MAYATQQDLINYGVQPQVLGRLQPSQINAILQSASDKADGYGRARWGYTACPLVTWDTDWTANVTKLAAYEIHGVAGTNPESADFKLAKIRLADAEAYFDKVQRQQIHPLVTLGPAGSAVALPGQQQPLVMSSSVVDLANGRRARNRGW
jgi:hypothetical protein